MYDAGGILIDGVVGGNVREGVIGNEEDSGLRRIFTIQTIEVPMATQTGVVALDGVMGGRKLVTSDVEEEKAVETGVPAA